MQRTAFPRRRPLVQVIVGLAAAVLPALAIQAAPLAGNLIGVYHFGTAVTVNDLAGTASVNGSGGRGELLLASDGNFYSVMSTGGAAGAGVVMRVGPDGSAVVLHAFKGDTTEGAVPYAGVIQASDGNLYGTTYAGGTKSLGAVYRVGLDGTYTTVYSFTSDTQGGYHPYAGLVQGPDGALYGTTLQGGSTKSGTVFRLTLDGSYTQLFSFTGANGSNPEGSLVVGRDGLLYGTTMTGGTNDRGTVFKITTTGTHTLLHSFETLGNFNANGDGVNANGSNPRAGLRQGPDGNFYGTAYNGGPGGYGTVFRITPSGTVSLVHGFVGMPGDGAHPLSPVTVMPDGTLYGTASAAGSSGGGVAWRASAAGVWSILHAFTGSAQSLLTSDMSIVDGTTPYVGLVPLNGQLYGMTFTDIATSSGNLFKIDVGSGGVLPVNFSVSPESITLGGSAVLTWSSPTAAKCSTSEAWAETIATSGTVAVSPASAGVFNYAISCTDGAGVTRYTRAALTVTTPPTKSVDGGATNGGGGAAGILSLLLLAGASGAVVRRRLRPASL